MVTEYGTDDLVDALFALTGGINLFVEVGAYRAEFSRRAALEHPDATIMALEANPHTWQQYAPTMPERIEYLNVAACPADGPVTFALMALQGGAHLPRIAGNNGLRQRLAHGIEYDPLIVDGRALDSLLAERGLTGQPCVMWWDVEGAQDLVIAGAHAALTDCVALLLEVEEYAYWRDQPLVSDVDAALARFGLVPVARDREFPDQHNRIYAPRIA